MNSTKKTLISNRNKLTKIIFKLSSLKITVTCLFLLFLQTFVGTIYQTEYGLYAAQQKIFYSFITFFFDYIPFIGTQSVIWVIGINLLCGILTKLPLKWDRIGLWLSHGGLVLLLAGSFTTFYWAKESALSLREGEGKNYSSDYHLWELAMTREVKSSVSNWIKKDHLTWDFNKIDENEILDGEDFGVVIEIDKKYSHARASRLQNPEMKDYFNPTGIGHFQPGTVKRGEELPALLITVKAKKKPYQLMGKTKDSSGIALWGGEEKAGVIRFKKENKIEAIHFKLRKKIYPLPIKMELEEFITENHPGTEIASRYESVAYMYDEGQKQKVRIYMNHPLRVNGMTFFQASFFRDEQKGEGTVLAVVQNAAMWIPYISSLAIFFGLLVHFVIVFNKRFIKKYKRRSKEVG